MAVQKVPVQCLVHDGTYTTQVHTHPYKSTSKCPNYRVRFPDESQLDALRYAIDELIAEKPIYKTMFDTTGVVWKVSDSFFSLFKDWLILPDDLDTMRKQAREEFERQEKEKEERLEQERLDRIASRKQYRIECQYKRIPCTAPCNAPVIKIDCLRAESYHEDGDIRYYFAVELDPGSTKQQKAARLQLAKALASDHSTGLFYRTDNIKGRGCTWILHEYVLLAYSDWLELDAPIETILSFAIEKLKQEELRKAEEKAREQEERQKAHDQYWKEYQHWQHYQEFRLPTDTLSSALLIFNLDETANLEIIKKRYRTLAKQYHPDTGGDEVKFKELNNANQVLMQHFS